MIIVNYLGFRYKAENGTCPPSKRLCIKGFQGVFDIKDFSELGLST